MDFLLCVCVHHLDWPTCCGISTDTHTYVCVCVCVCVSSSCTSLCMFDLISPSKFQFSAVFVLL